ncbi:MAG: hypothetical protein KHX03_05660 [Clostridium sp.]|nr:hypothetical protein [Clostridium sp.]
MTNKDKGFELIIYICLIIVLGVIYFACFNAAQKGYGYPGYGGYHRTHYHSWWYVRNYDESYYPSNRENSVGGNRFSQRGLSGGK